MLKDEERIRVSTRTDDPRRDRPSPRVYRVPVPLDIAPPRNRRGPLLVIAALLVVAAAAFVAARTWVAPGVDARLAGADPTAGAPDDGAPATGARIMAPAEIRASQPGSVS